LLAETAAVVTKQELDGPPCTWVWDRAAIRACGDYAVDHGTSPPPRACGGYLCSGRRAVLRVVQRLSCYHAELAHERITTLARARWRSTEYLIERTRGPVEGTARGHPT
jgi:hypothetical protein